MGALHSWIAKDRSIFVVFLGRSFGFGFEFLEFYWGSGSLCLIPFLLLTSLTPGSKFEIEHSEST